MAPSSNFNCLLNYTCTCLMVCRPFAMTYAKLANLPTKWGYTRIFVQLCTHIFLISSALNLYNTTLVDFGINNNLMSLKSLKMMIKSEITMYNLHNLALTLIFSLILKLASLILGYWGWQVCLCTWIYTQC